MLPMICAAILRVSVLRSRKARSTTGMMSASEGASMKCTNWVSSSVCRHAEVLCEGSCTAASSTGTMAWISGLRMTEPMTLSAAPPACCTRVCESLSTSMRRGTMLGRQPDSCLGAQ